MECNLTNKPDRIHWVDACKGIGIILVVLGHIAVGYEGAGLFPEYAQTLVRIGYYAYAFHMTLLFILSGYTFYKAYGQNIPDGKDNYIRQMLNLVWIFAVCSVLWWVVKRNFSDNVNIKLTVNDMLWFFSCFFII